MLTAGTFMEHGPWPVHPSHVPSDMTMKELVPTASFSPQPVTSDFDKYWDKLGRPYEIELRHHLRCQYDTQFSEP